MRSAIAGASGRSKGGVAPGGPTSEYGSYVTGARTPEDADAASPHATHR